MSDGESRKKVRSPSFPFIGLREALDRARAFYEAEQRNAARSETAAAHWGYSAKSSGGKQTIAALRSFGLLEGDSLVKLSGRGLRLVLDERGASEERERLLQQAALMPPVHARLWERYGAELPSVQTLRLGLILDEGFNENSVDDFLSEYRETLEYARLLQRPVPEEAQTPAEKPASPPPPRIAAETAGIDPMIFPLLDGNAVELRIRRKISSAEVEDLRTVFELWLRKIVER
ncbi:MAG TPA: hypothetical protein VIE43_13135 [Thermoanaerobaculia bacterium]|jgi:hypothetical protein|nr:hypothetical protein [Thermoanaerobaculia bacterium]